MRRSVSGALAGAVLLAAALAWGDENPPATEPAGISDEEVARLVEQMSSSQFRERQEAFEKLESLGAGIVAKLEPYRSHEDMEVRRRVQGLIDVYQWARTGRLISTIEKGTQAERLGIRVGDVVVKVDQVDIVKAKDFNKVPDNITKTYHILRGGRILTFEVALGRVGFSHVYWSGERGGNDHAQAYVALAAGDLEEAYRRLKKAHQAGEDSFRALQVLSGLAEYHLEHDEAMRYYMAYRRRDGDDNCWLSHRNLEKEYYGLPLSGPHAAWLLGRLKREGFNPELYHQAEDWFTFKGINLPLARELVRAKWTHDAGTKRQRSRHFTAKMRIALHDRDYDTVLKGYRLWPDTKEYPFIPQLAIRAAVKKGDLDTAVKAAVDVLNSYRKGEASASRACVALYAVAAAAASGNEYLTEKLLGEMSRLEPEQLDGVLNYVTNDTWRHRAVIPHVAAFWRRNPLEGTPEKSNYLRLEMLSCSADLKPSVWGKQYRRYQREKTDRGHFWLNAVAMMRFGAYD